MKKSELVQYEKFIFNKFEGYRPGEIVRFNNIAESIRKNFPLDYRNAIKVLFLMMVNGFIEQKDNTFVALTDDGYNIYKEDEPHILKIELSQICDIRQKKENLFYDVWELIGKNDDNPYYVKGSDFYNIIRKGLDSLPPTYASYVETLPLKENGSKQSRLDWYKTLFLQLTNEQVEPFLNQLSSKINENLISSIPSEDDETMNFDNNDMAYQQYVSENKDNQRRAPKIFISHNTKDSKYAEALVDLMIKLGVKYEDIFCSSVPGCGPIFGGNIFKAIHDQFNKYDLLVLFIHSPRYYESVISLNEMGAAWILKSDHRSFLTSDCEFDALTGVIKSDEAAFKAGQDNTYHYLHNFRRTLVEKFGLNDVRDEVWDSIKEKFIRTVSNI